MNKSDSINKDVNVILGPGAARGFIHVGAIRALLANNFQIHSIVGSSMGAIVGWYFASTGHMDDAERFATDFNKNSPLFIKKYSGLLRIDNRKLKEYLLSHTNGKDLTFEEMQLPLIVVATDVKTGKAAFLNSGSVIDAIIASSTIPFINKPYQIDDKYYIDGGFVADPLTHMPAQLLNDYPYIGINVSHKSRKKKDFANNESMYLQSTLLQKLYKVKMDLSASSLEKIEKIVHIKSDDENIRSYDFNKALECFNIGESIVNKNLNTINKSLI